VAAAPAPAENSPVGITTRVSPSSVALGSSFHDTATLSPGVPTQTSTGPTPDPPTGSVTFAFYPPSDSTCDSGDPVFSGTSPVDPATGTATSENFTPTQKGAYHVVAAYSGDANYGSASTQCGDPGETENVVQPIRVTGGGGAPPAPAPAPTPPAPPAPPASPAPGTPPPTGPPSGPGSGSGGSSNDMPLVATANVLSSTAAELSATVDAHGLPTTVHFEYSWAGGVGATAAAITYQLRTPEQVVGADFADHPIVVRVTGLVPNSSYHLRAVARNAAGVTLGLDSTFRTAQDPPPPPPVLGKSFNAEPISGVVQVLVGHGKGAHFTALTEPRQLPVGTVFDTSRGSARLTTATAKRGRVQSGNFASGLFKVLQNRRQLGLTELDLVISSKVRNLCAKAGKAQTAAKRALPKALLTLLRANAKGKFRTQGRFSSATVRGTTWTTADRCDGTFTLVKRGVVVVNDRRRQKNIVLRAGRSYLAKAP
jgi:hypothetical protein